MKKAGGRRAKEELVDGLGPKDLVRIRSALRQAWSWSYARRLCLKRSLLENGFSQCESCKEIVAKVQADHIVPCGTIDERFIERLFCSSKGLQALCKKCHGRKTKEQRDEAKKPSI